MALERKILPEQFWGSSVLEVSDMISAFDRIRTEDIRQRIDLAFVSTDALATRIARILADEKSRRKIQILYPWNVYPELFEDRSEEIAEAQAAREMNEYKAGLMAFADRWNRREE